MNRKGRTVKDEKQETCPNCGYCPTCGRAQASWPVYPGTNQYPYPYVRPWWGTITVSGGNPNTTSSTQAVSPAIHYSLTN